MFMSSTSTRIARQARKVGNAPKNAVKAHRAAKASDAAAEVKLANLKAKGVHIKAPAVEFDGSSYRTAGTTPVIIEVTPTNVGDFAKLMGLMEAAKGTEAEAYFTALFNASWVAMANDGIDAEVPAEEVVVGTALLVSDTVVIPKVSLIRKVGKVVKVVVLAVVKVAVFVALWAAIIYAYLCVLLTAVCLIVIALGKLGIIKTDDPAAEAA